MLKLIAVFRTWACTDLRLKELGVRSLGRLWWKRTVCFWNNLASLPCTNVHYQVDVQNCNLAVAQGLTNWAVGVMTSLRRLGFRLLSGVTSWTSLTGVSSVLAWRAGRMRPGQIYISPLSYDPLLGRSGVLIFGGML
jgi:hypothetical protein